MEQQPKLEGLQLDLRKDFPEEYRLLVPRVLGPPIPINLIAKMSWLRGREGGEEGIRQTGAPPSPPMCHLLAPSRVPPPGGQDYHLRDPGHGR